MSAVPLHSSYDITISLARLLVAVLSALKEHAAEPNSNAASIEDALTTLASYEDEAGSFCTV